MGIPLESVGTLRQAIIPDPLVVAPHETIAAVLALMSRAAEQHPVRGSCVLLIDANQPVRIFTESDLVRVVASGIDLAGTPVEAHTSPALTCRSSDVRDPAMIIRLLHQQRRRHLVVLDHDQQLVGVAVASEVLYNLGYDRIVQRNSDLSHQLTQQISLLQTQTINLRRSEIHLMAAQRIAALGSWEFLPHTGEITWSEGIFRIFGRDPQLGPPTFDELQAIYHPDDREHHSRTVARALEQFEPYDLELRLYRPDGSMRYIQARGEPVFDDEGCLQRLVGTVLDITARKEIEIQLRTTSAQLSVANQELESFAYSVSHDLRAPLRAIDGFSRALVEDYGDQLAAPAQAYLERIHVNIKRMGMLIDDLLRLSRVSRSEMNYTWVDLSSEAQRTIATLQMHDPERLVDVQIAPGLQVRADRDLLRIALENLLSNAWKFTAHRETARISVELRRIDEEKVFVIADNGAGFDQAYVHKLFGVFQRLHNSDEFPGTGIGLATTQRVIQRHGGRIWAEGVVDQGATFFFSLPAGRA